MGMRRQEPRRPRDVARAEERRARILIVVKGRCSLALWTDPRVEIGIPIIGACSFHLLLYFRPLTVGRPTGCPDYLTLISRRCRSHGLPVGPPYLPDSLLAHIRRADPTAAPYAARDASNPFWGKKVLVLSGGDDKIVPWAASRACP